VDSSVSNHSFLNGSERVYGWVLDRPSRGGVVRRVGRIHILNKESCGGRSGDLVVVVVVVVVVAVVVVVDKLVDGQSNPHRWSLIMLKREDFASCHLISSDICS
jgi:hypothetical protein